RARTRQRHQEGRSPLEGDGSGGGLRGAEEAQRAAEHREEAQGLRGLRAQERGHPRRPTRDGLRERQVLEGGREPQAATPAPLTVLRGGCMKASMELECESSASFAERTARNPNRR